MSLFPDLCTLRGNTGICEVGLAVRFYAPRDSTAPRPCTLPEAKRPFMIASTVLSFTYDVECSPP
jgi:hypothetical protein